MSTKKPSKGQARRITLSNRTKIVLLAGSGSALLVAVGWWAYFTFTTITPPDVATTPPTVVAHYLGDTRGFARLNYDQREKFLGDMWNQCGQGEKRAELAQAFERMSSYEKQVFVDATFDTVKVRFLEQATEYNRLPPNKRDQYIENVLNNLQGQRQALGGNGAAAGAVAKAGTGAPRAKQDNLLKAFENSIPNTTDGLAKALTTRTNARQRAKAQPLLDAITTKAKEQEERRKSVR